MKCVNIHCENEAIDYKVRRCVSCHEKYIVRKQKRKEYLVGEKKECSRSGCSRPVLYGRRLCNHHAPGDSQYEISKSFVIREPQLIKSRGDKLIANINLRLQEIYG